MKKFFKIILLFSFILVCCSFNTPSEEGIKKVITEVFEMERLSKLGGEVPSSENLSSNVKIKNALDSKHKFYRLWREKLEQDITDFNQELTFDKIENQGEYFKVFLSRNLEFKSSDFLGITHKSYNEKYIVIVSSKDNKYLIDAMVFQEESPEVYENLATNKENYRSSNSSDYISDWKERLDDIDIMYRNFKLITTSHHNFTSAASVNDKDYNRGYNPSAACAYAQKYALNYNPEYKDFSNSGGDCTNFISQCLYAGGLKKTNTWKPYTNAWHSNQFLRNYLVNNKIAIEYPTISPKPVGSIIQFFNPEKKRWAHSGIITYATKKDYLYCCHTYNKLNYPLSGVYPVFYRKIRVLEIH
ncbi:MAG: amidase domain-containing protein [Clostridiaceae bacterium]